MTNKRIVGNAFVVAIACLLASPFAQAGTPAEYCAKKPQVACEILNIEILQSNRYESQTSAGKSLKTVTSRDGEVISDLGTKQDRILTEGRIECQSTFLLEGTYTPNPATGKRASMMEKGTFATEIKKGQVVKIPTRIPESSYAAASASLKEKLPQVLSVKPYGTIENTCVCKGGSSGCIFSGSKDHDYVVPMLKKACMNGQYVLLFKEQIFNNYIREIDADDCY